jgi:hypothetical protein
MVEDGFRAVVRAELELWMEKNRPRFDVFCRRVADVMLPILQQEIKDGIMVRIGDLAPDERQAAAMLLEEAAAYIRRFMPAKNINQWEEADNIARQLERAAQNYNQPGPMRPGT